MNEVQVEEVKVEGIKYKTGAGTSAIVQLGATVFVGFGGYTISGTVTNSSALQDMEEHTQKILEDNARKWSG